MAPDTLYAVWLCYISEHALGSGVQMAQGGWKVSRESVVIARRECIIRELWDPSKAEGHLE